MSCNGSIPRPMPCCSSVMGEAPTVAVTMWSNRTCPGWPSSSSLTSWWRIIRPTVPNGIPLNIGCFAMCIERGKARSFMISRRSGRSRQRHRRARASPSQCGSTRRPMLQGDTFLMRRNANSKSRLYLMITFPNGITSFGQHKHQSYFLNFT